jgi:hypothetical protein
MYLNLRGSVSFLALAATAMLLPVLGTATPILGTFGFAGPGVFVFKTGSADFIRFCTTADSSCSAAATATGSLTVSGPGTQSFSILTAGETGAVDNITDVTPPASPYTYFPIATTVAINNWLTLNGAGSTWNFQANLLPFASCIATPTQQCIGPFQLNQSGPNVSVTVNIFGTIISGTDSSAFDATFTGQYNATTIAAVASAAQTPTGILSNSWSGTINATAIPEPNTASTILLLGAGLVAVGLARRRKLSV